MPEADRRTHLPTKPVISTATTGIRVLFADDQQIVRQGLVRLVANKPDIAVVGEAANGLEVDLKP